MNKGMLLIALVLAAVTMSPAVATSFDYTYNFGTLSHTTQGGRIRWTNPDCAGHNRRNRPGAGRHSRQRHPIH